MNKCTGQTNPIEMANLTVLSYSKERVTLTGNTGISSGSGNNGPTS
jgi:hypothetical protein